MSPDLDALVDRYFTTIPRPDRVEVERQIVHWQGDQLIFMGLFYVTSHTATSALDSFSSCGISAHSPIW